MINAELSNWAMWWWKQWMLTRTVFTEYWTLTSTLMLTWTLMWTLTRTLTWTGKMRQVACSSQLSRFAPIVLQQKARAAKVPVCAISVPAVCYQCAISVPQCAFFFDKLISRQQTLYCSSLYKQREIWECQKMGEFKKLYQQQICCTSVIFHV